MSSDRDISALNIGALNASIVRPILFVRADFDAAVLRRHTEIGPRDAVHPVFGNETYLGLGDFGGITADLKEQSGNAAQPVKVGLSGVDVSFVGDIVANDDYHGRDIEFMLGFDDQDGVLIDDPVILWGGYMDKADFIQGPQTADIVLTCESREVLLQGNSDLRFTDEQLQHDHPGDLAAEYIFRMLDIILTIGGDTAGATGSDRGFTRGSRTVRASR